MFKAFKNGNEQKMYFVKEIEQSTPNEIKDKLQDIEQIHRLKSSITQKVNVLQFIGNFLFS